MALPIASRMLLKPGALRCSVTLTSWAFAERSRMTETPFVYRMHYALPEPAPLVSIVIPTKDHVETLDACVMSIAQKATYANYEIVLVENNSEAPETFAYYETLPECVAAASEGKGIARVVFWPGEFNYSQIINFGVEHAKGDYLLLLNNDTEVMSAGFHRRDDGLSATSRCGCGGRQALFCRPSGAARWHFGWRAWRTCPCQPGFLGKARGLSMRAPFARATLAP